MQKTQKNKQDYWSVFMMIVIIMAIGTVVWMLAMAIFTGGQKQMVTDLNKVPMIQPPVEQIKGENQSMGQITTQNNLVVSYAGELPCADCPGIMTELTIEGSEVDADHGTFTLKETYKERSVEPEVTRGDWIIMYGTTQDPKAEVFLLIPSDGSRVIFFKRVNGETLRQLDTSGNEIETTLNYDLNRLEDHTLVNN